MSKRLCLICIGIVALSYLLIGCGVRPQVDFYVNPIATGEEQRLDEEAGSVAVEEAGVSITVSALDTVDLLEVTSDAHVNPYVYVSDWGVARPRYTVFDVTVKNKSESEFMIKPSSAVLMDEQGEQYNAIPYEEFRERYGAYPRLEREIIYHRPPYAYYRRPYYRRRWRPHPWYYHYDRYWDHRPYYVPRFYNAAYFRRAILSGTMLKPVKLYPGGRRQGFLVFPPVSPDASELKIIFPDIMDEEGRRLEFHFERIPAVKD
jgi:hypothetical protein